MMWEACAEKMKALGGKLEMGCRVTRCSYDESSGNWTVEYKDRQGESADNRSRTRHFIRADAGAGLRFVTGCE